MTHSWGNWKKFKKCLFDFLAFFNDSIPFSRHFLNMFKHSLKVLLKIVALNTTPACKFRHKLIATSEQTEKLKSPFLIFIPLLIVRLFHFAISTRIAPLFCSTCRLLQLSEPSEMYRVSKRVFATELRWVVWTASHEKFIWSHYSQTWAISTYVRGMYVLMTLNNSIQVSTFQRW